MLTGLAARRILLNNMLRNGLRMNIDRRSKGDLYVGTSQTLARRFGQLMAVILSVAFLNSLSPLVKAETLIDTALIVAVDASESVDDERFQLQMNGIAQALEDPSVLAAILGGKDLGILLSVVVWADQSTIAIPWTHIQSKEQAHAMAAKVRALPRTGGEFTCLARMLRTMKDTLVQEVRSKWSKYTKVIIDVSGDGPDNCSNKPTLDGIRETLVNDGVVINGLPIITDPDQLVGVTAYMAPGNSMEVRSARKYFPEALTLEQWYRKHVIAGGGSFLIPAFGYQDFGRAMRAKFVTEISGAFPRHMTTANIVRRKSDNLVQLKRQ